MSSDDVAPAADSDVSEITALRKQVESLSELVEQQAQRIDELEQQVEQNTDSINSALTYSEFNLVMREFGNDPDGKLIQDVTEDAIQSGAKDVASEVGDRLNHVEQRTTKAHDRLDQRQKGNGADEAEHWEKVVELAHRVKDQQKHQATGSYIQLWKDDIASAIDPGERRASQLMDEWGGERDGASEKNGMRYEPWSPKSNAKNGAQRRKHILVDIDYWEDPR
jgi:hypothetical protein